MSAEIPLEFDGYMAPVTLHFDTEASPQYLYKLKEAINSQLKDHSKFFKLPVMKLTTFPCNLLQHANWITDVCMSFNHFTMIPVNVQLKRLTVDHNKLTSPFTVPIHIETIYVDSNNLKKVVLKNGNDNKEVFCSNNLIETIVGDFSKIQKLVCSNNQIKKLLLGESFISHLNCGNNRISELTLPLTLTHLLAYTNELDGPLDLRRYERLRYINVVGNNLSSLLLPPYAQTVECSSNSIKYLKVRDNVLYLLCSNNQLDTVYLHTKLKYVTLENNPLRKVVFRGTPSDIAGLNLKNTNIKIVTPYAFLEKVINEYECSNDMKTRVKKIPIIITNSSAYCIQKWWKKRTWNAIPEDCSVLEIDI